MKTADFDFGLPQSLIAQQPACSRTGSRLLHVNRSTQSMQDLGFTDFISLLQPNDLLVFNNTKVMRARLFARKATGGQIEILVERLHQEDMCLVHMRVSKKPKAGDILYINDKPAFEMLGRVGALFMLRYLGESLIDYIESVGHIPLPPYIEREDNQNDDTRYQTVYAKHLGAVAAPTAGLHFDEKTLAAIRVKGIQTAEVTLHVGAGTFQPVKVDDVAQHEMHAERIIIDEPVCDAIQACRERGGASHRNRYHGGSSVRICCE